MFSVLPQCPPDGFLVEEFFGVNVRQNGKFKPIGLSVFAVFELANDGTPVDPHVFGCRVFCDG